MLCFFVLFFMVVHVQTKDDNWNVSLRLLVTLIKTTHPDLF